MNHSLGYSVIVGSSASIVDEQRTLLGIAPSKGVAVVSRDDGNACIGNVHVSRGIPIPIAHGSVMSLTRITGLG